MKPEKKDYRPEVVHKDGNTITKYSTEYWEGLGYNQAYKDWEKWIEEAPIKKLLCKSNLVSEEADCVGLEMLIRKLLKGDK